MQRLSEFTMPPGFRGRSAVAVQFWWLVQSVLFRLSPQFAYGFRRFILRLFGAEIGEGVLIRPTATFTYPWRVSIGSHAWIGDDVVVYSVGRIRIGANSVVSQRSYLCAGDHDYRLASFPIRARPITIGEGVWIGADVFVGPDVSVGSGAVVGVRSSVFGDLPEGMVCLGSPCRPVKPRIMRDGRQDEREPVCSTTPDAERPA